MSSFFRPLALALALSAAAGGQTPTATAQPAARWYKGNLHTHSLWSDGNDYPEVICHWYREQGYHFLALSDHNILSQGTKWIAADAAERRGAVNALERYRKLFGDDWVETRQEKGLTQVRLKPLDEFRVLLEERDRFLLIPAEEITDGFGPLPVHVNATNVQELIRPRGGGSVRETIANNLAAVRSQSQRLGRPILAHLNHPNFGYGVSAEDLAHVLEERFFEVYNGHPDVHHLGDQAHDGVERLWDIANTLRVAELHAPPLLGLATDDTHNYFGNRGASPGRGWVMVRADGLSAEALLGAIARGDFYATSGVLLDELRYDPREGALELRIAALPKTKYVTRFIGTRRGYDNRREPAVDADGKPREGVFRYSQDVGAVLATAEGPNPSYKLTGDELYVRATVTSDRPPINPSFAGQQQQAWTQPVGWERWVREGSPERASGGR
jgi:hypothetical protein